MLSSHPLRGALLSRPGDSFIFAELRFAVRRKEESKISQIDVHESLSKQNRAKVCFDWHRMMMSICFNFLCSVPTARPTAFSSSFHKQTLHGEMMKISTPGNQIFMISLTR
jgi:hypothetical protein